VFDPHARAPSGRSIETLGYDLWSALGGVLHLDGAAFARATRLGGAVYAALAIVLLAGLSEAVAQSAILFANRVKPERFVFSIAINAVLFAFGYAFLVLSTWAVCLLPLAVHVPLGALAIVFAFSYAPLLFAFFGGLPYLGLGVQWVLRIWHLLAMVTGFAAVAGVTIDWATVYVGIGWLVMVIGEHTFGRPIAALGVQLLDRVAGVQLRSDTAIESGAPIAQDGSAPRHGDHVRLAVGPPAPARHLPVWLGLGFVVLLTAAIAWVLSPLHYAVIGHISAPAIARLPLDLIWIALIGAIVAGMLAPLETLGWWAGWYGDTIDVTDAERAQTTEPAKGPGARRYVVYLDGIAQSSARYTPDIETFLDALQPELPADVRLVRGIMAYSVINRPLDDDPIFAAFWKFVDAARLKNFNSLLGMIINLRNVLVVAVSADSRYGPMYNFGIARVIYDALIAQGYRLHSGVPVTLIGYSGGGQMSAGAGPILRRALDAPVDVISLGGVISGSNRVLELEHLYHCVGSKDSIQRLGPIMFASRWRVAFASNWNRARRRGRISYIPLGPVGHQVPGGMLDPDHTLADGRTFLRQTLDDVLTVLRDEVEPTVPPALAAPVAAAIAPPVVAEETWIGRLVVPPRTERERLRGVRFDVRAAPSAHHALAGRTVLLRWKGEGRVRDAVRAATGDVHFCATAVEAGRAKALVLPGRLDQWQLVDPLESLAAAHATDDVVVRLDGVVDVGVDAVAGETVLTVARDPVVLCEVAAPPVTLSAGGNGDVALVCAASDSQLVFGIAEASRDGRAGRHYNVVWYRLAPHDPTGTISGALCGLPPPAGGTWEVSAWTTPAFTAAVADAVRGQFGVIAARYRTGDGSGLTSAGFGNTAAQDAVRALCSALSTSEQLARVAIELRNALQPFARMPQKGDAPFDLASTFDDGPLERVRGSIGGWRLWRPRAAARALGSVLSRHGWHGVTAAARAGTNERAAEPARSEVRR
jgi:hypothetical protein